MDCIEMGCEGTDCIHLAKNRLKWQTPVNAVMNPLGSLKSGEFLDKLSSC
jgi:hypothetical protein